MTTTITVSKARYLAAAQVFVPAKDVRYYLCGIHLSRPAAGDGVRVTGTDGHRLIDIHDAAGDSAGVVSIIITFTREQVAAFKRKNGRDQPVLITLAEDSATCSHAGVTTLAAVVDGKFPDVDRVIPAADREGSVSAIGLNPDYVADFATVCRLLADAELSKTIWRFDDADSAVRIDFPDCEHATGVLMPLRI